MGAELLFESRSANHVLRQAGSVEEAPYLALRLDLLDGPIIYVSDGSVVHPSAWRLVIRRGPLAESPLLVSGSVSGTLRYAATGAKPRCIIDVDQSPERYAALLDMFRGGGDSEITVTVDALADRADYSKFWNTALHPSIAVQAICFEFPLPQNEA